MTRTSKRSTRTSEAFSPHAVLIFGYPVDLDFALDLPGVLRRQVAERLSVQREFFWLFIHVLCSLRFPAQAPSTRAIVVCLVRSVVS